jgi:hypothetical protein
MGYLLRILGALALVLLTYNPTGLSYVTWARDAWADSAPFVALAGLILLIGYLIYVRATIRSIGGFGIALVGALVAVLVWIMVDMGWMAANDQTALTWAGLIGVALILGIGLSWSLIRRRLSGQADTDDVEDQE